MFELWSDNFKEIKTYSLFLCASEAKKKKKKHWEDRINSFLPIYTLSVPLQ